MSVYDKDLRVQLHADGTATLPDGPGGLAGDWQVFERDSVWMARNEGQGFLKSRFNADYPATYRSRDEAISALIGEPQVSA